MLFVSCLFALGSHGKQNFWWNTGLTLVTPGGAGSAYSDWPHFFTNAYESLDGFLIKKKVFDINHIRVSPGLPVNTMI